MILLIKRLKYQVSQTRKSRNKNVLDKVRLRLAQVALEVNMIEVSIHSLPKVVSFKWNTPLKPSKYVASYADCISWALQPLVFKQHMVLY